MRGKRVVYVRVDKLYAAVSLHAYTGDQLSLTIALRRLDSAVSRQLCEAFSARVRFIRASLDLEWHSLSNSVYILVQVLHCSASCAVLRSRMK